MHPASTHLPRLRSRLRARQRGIALVIVIVLVLVSALLALWGFRSAVLNEAVVGNDADYQRAFEAAQALLQDAEYDIRGERPDGQECIPDATQPKVCRPEGSTVWFIDETKDFTDLLNTLQAQSSGCLQGICIKRIGAQDFWNDAKTLTAMMADGVGARYGEYTGASTGTASNPLLAERGSGRGGWYWIEVMQYSESGGPMVGKPKLELTLNPNLVYRITALARGTREGTQVVLQSTYVQQKLPS